MEQIKTAIENIEKELQKIKALCDKHEATKETKKKRETWVIASAPKTVSFD